MTTHLNKKTAVIINADDFGASELHVDTTFDLFQKGRISSTTFLPNYAYSQEAAKRILHEHPELIQHMGLHVNLISHPPLSQSIRSTPYVSPNGDLRDFRVCLSLWSQLRFLKALTEEIDTQIRFFKELFGHYPCHVDSHGQALMSFSGFLALLLSREARHVPAIRMCRTYPYVPVQSLQQAFRRPLGRVMNLGIRLRFSTASAFLGLRFLDDSFLSEEYMAKVSSRFQSIEIMTHPALGKDTTEYAFLSENQWISDNPHFYLTSYADFLHKP